jgi:hypothetical protein
MVKELTKSPLITAIVGQAHAVQSIERPTTSSSSSRGEPISNQSPAAGLPAETQDDGRPADCVEQARPG